MKYSNTNPPLQCFMNQSTWAQGAIKNGKPVGILWHDTAAGNPNIARYVQPDDDAPNRQEILSWLGVNPYGNDWNHTQRNAGLNCWVGKLVDGTVSTVQAGPWTTHAWGCGSGANGSCNGSIKKNGVTKNVPEFWIQFEICDDNYQAGTNTEAYFRAAYQEACEITAYLCQLFDIDPYGTVDFYGMKVPTILCHYDSYQLGLGSGHTDIYKWFNMYGYTMDNVRNDVAALLADAPAPIDILPGDLVSIKPDALWYSGRSIPSWVQEQNWYVLQVDGDRAVLNDNEAGTAHIMSSIHTSDLTLIWRPNSIKAGDIGRLKPGAHVYSASGEDMGYEFSSWVYDSDIIVAQVQDTVAQFSVDLTLQATTGWTAIENILVKEEVEPDPEPAPKPDPEPVEPEPAPDPEPDPEPEPEPPVKEDNWLVRLLKAILAALKHLFHKD